MANLPEVGLNAVIENLNDFKKGADSITDAYDDINEAAEGVESTTSIASGAIGGLGAVASTVATGGLALLVTAVAAVAAAAVAAVASIGLLAKAAFDLSSEVEKSQKDIQTQLGLTEEASEDLAETARDVWANNFAGSIDEATAALIEVRKQLKGISDEELQDATENAIRLSDAFGVDITESTNAANVLMKQFGLTQQEAFDFIAKGFQKGLNTSDDFLDSISEYGNLFGQAGGDAGEFFSLMETGLQGGVLGTDKAADAFKEFQVRFLEGGDEVQEVFADMGEDWQEWVDGTTNGTFTMTDNFQDIIDMVSGIEDPIERNRIGVALMGTQFEDLGAEAVAGISLATSTMEDFAGATDSLNAQYNTLPKVFEGVKRKLLVAIQPIGDALLDAANEVMPMLLDAIEDLKPALEDFAVLLGEWIKDAVKNLIPWIRDTLVPALKDFGRWITDVGLPALEDFGRWFVNKGIPALEDFGKFIKKDILPILEDFWDWFINDGIPALEKFWKFVKKFILPIFKELWKVAKVVMKFLAGDWEGAWKDMVATAKEWVEKIRKLVSDKWEEIKRNAADKWEEIKQKIADKWEEIKRDAKEKAQEMINNIINKIKESPGKIATALKNMITDALSDLKNSITGGSIYRKLSSVGTEIINGIMKGFDTVTNFVSTLVGKLAGWLSNIVSQVVNTASSIGNIVKNIGAQIVSTILKGISTFTAFASTVKAAITGWVVSIVNNLGAIATAAWLMGRKVIDNLLTGVSSMSENFKTWIKDKIEEWLGDIFSPIPMAQYVGKEIMANIQLGILAQKGPFIGGLRASLVDWIAQSGAGLTGNFAIPATVSGPALGAGGTTSISNTYYLGGNNIASNMDAATFEARVLQVIRRNL